MLKGVLPFCCSLAGRRGPKSWALKIRALTSRVLRLWPLKTSVLKLNPREVGTGYSRVLKSGGSEAQAARTGRSKSGSGEPGGSEILCHGRKLGNFFATQLQRLVIRCLGRLKTLWKFGGSHATDESEQNKGYKGCEFHIYIYPKPCLKHTQTANLRLAYHANVKKHLTTDERDLTFLSVGFWKHNIERGAYRHDIGDENTR